VADPDFADDKGRRFLAILSPDGSKQSVVRLRPLQPDSVTVSGDGTIWRARLPGKRTGSGHL
jgi:hypothetical protein